MLRGIKGRLSKLEQSMRPPTTVDRFLATIEVHARLTGLSQKAALQALVVTLSDEDLEHLSQELQRRLAAIRKRRRPRGAKL